MKICFIIPSLQAGGMERVMAQLIDHFADRNSIDLHLILYGRHREVFYNLPSNIQIHRPYFSFDNSKRTWHTIKTLAFLRKKVKALQPDSVLSFGELWNNLVLLALAGLDYPVYISDRCRPDKSLGKFQDALRKWLYPKATGIIAQTEKAFSFFKEEIGHSNVKVIGNPIREIEKDPTIEKENIVLSVGRLIDTKHFDELIKLFLRINKSGWKLVIVGDDAQQQNNREKLEALINEKNASDKVELAGQRNDVDQFYKRCKIFAFTSSSEGFPNVVGEAQSAGLPVVAFDCIAGPSDMIKDGENGYLVPLFDFERFEHCLETLMDNSAIRTQMGAKAQESIQKFSKGQIGEEFLDFITENSQSWKVND